MKISEELFSELLEGNMGVCLACGSEEEECEPDLEGRKCSQCGQLQVVGLEWALISGDLEVEP